MNEENNVYNDVHNSVQNNVHKERMSDTQYFFNVGFIVMFFIITTFLLYHMGGTSPSSYLPPCMLHEITGFSCFGCGTTRAVTALYSGDIIESLKMNPIAVYFFILYIPFMITNLIATVRNCIYVKKETAMKIAASNLLNDKLPYKGMKYRNIYFNIGIAIIFIFGIARFVLELLTRIQ